MTSRISPEAKTRIEAKYKEMRASKIYYLQQQLDIFKKDLLRFENQIEEIKELNNKEGDSKQ